MNNSVWEAILGPVFAGILFGGLLAPLIYFITSSRKKLRYMEAQIRLLMHIAAANQISQDKIAEIVAEADLPEFQGRK